MRARDGIASLRRGHIARIVRGALRAGGSREGFRVVEFNVLQKQLHLIVEATHAMRLSRGLQGLAVRFARRINRALARRGKFFADRYHARTLRTPSEVRHAIRYVLNHARLHGGRDLGRSWFDLMSSALWFTGWAAPLRIKVPWIRTLRDTPRPTASPTVWLLRSGWRRCGLLRLDEAPTAAPDEPGGFPH